VLASRARRENIVSLTLLKSEILLDLL